MNTENYTLDEVTKNLVNENEALLSEVQDLRANEDKLLDQIKNLRNLLAPFEKLKERFSEAEHKNTVYVDEIEILKRESDEVRLKLKEAAAEKKRIDVEHKMEIEKQHILAMEMYHYYETHLKAAKEKADINEKHLQSHIQTYQSCSAEGLVSALARDTKMLKSAIKIICDQKFSGKWAFIQIKNSERTVNIIQSALENGDSSEIEELYESLECPHINTSFKTPVGELLKVFKTFLNKDSLLGVLNDYSVGPVIEDARVLSQSGNGNSVNTKDHHHSILSLYECVTTLTAEVIILQMELSKIREHSLNCHYSFDGLVREANKVTPSAAVVLGNINGSDITSGSTYAGSQTPRRRKGLGIWA